MKIVVMDAEFSGLGRPKYMWCIVCKDVKTKEVLTFSMNNNFKGFSEFSKTVDLWVGANILCFDRPQVLRILGKQNVHWPLERTVDLQIVSRTVFFERKGGHSVENFAQKYGMVKPPIDVYDDINRLDDYIHRCQEDVEITYKMYKEFERFIFDKSWSKALRVEHNFALICQDMHEVGFHFNRTKATKLLSEIEKELEALTQEIVSEIGDVVDSTKEYTLKRNKDGTPSKNTARLLGFKDMGFRDGDKFLVTTYRPFNPASPKDRIEFLNACGWKPTIKTKTHKQVTRELREANRRGQKHLIDSLTVRYEKLKVTGWEVNEENLSTLPDDAPQAAQKLVAWLCLNGRKTHLKTWLEACREDSRIHGKFWHIGAWTHRTSHTDPNQGNIFSVTHLPKGKTEQDLKPVELIKYRWDAVLRSLWEASPQHILVGTDAEGIQLRILAHVMGDEGYAYAVANGRKEDETDVHNVNKRALGLNHITRDDSKTFILKLG